MKRRAAVEPVIGHIKAEHRMDRNYLKGRDTARPVLTVSRASTDGPVSAGCAFIAVSTITPCCLVTMTPSQQRPRNCLW